MWSVAGSAKTQPHTACRRASVWRRGARRPVAAGAAVVVVIVGGLSDPREGVVGERRQRVDRLRRRLLPDRRGLDLALDGAAHLHPGGAAASYAVAYSKLSMM